jgi:hypothetical protein
MVRQPAGRRLHAVGFVQPNPIDPHLLWDVLDGLLAEIIESEAELIEHLIADCRQDAGTADLSDVLESCGDVDAIAINVVAIYDHIADINAHTQLEAPIGSELLVAKDHCALHVDGTARRIDNGSAMLFDLIPLLHQSELTI